MFCFADLHCDLLGSLAHRGSKKYSPLDPGMRCSLPQLHKGHVALQVMAVWTLTGAGSTKRAERQIGIFDELPEHHPHKLVKFDSWETVEDSDGETAMMMSIENASGLFEEDELLEKGFMRLERLQENSGPILYISLTWNEENRFGGGMPRR